MLIFFGVILVILGFMCFYIPIEDNLIDNHSKSFVKKHKKRIQKNGEYSIKFQPLETQGMKLIIAFSDMNTMNQSELASNYSQRKFTNLRELASLMTAFDGVCLNPVF